ncbi:MAG: 16S rRNA (adenine(1518)-N(6)/adenine(1519)-N(6))-dimethyltransferase RsmA [bacterium]
MVCPEVRAEIIRALGEISGRRVWEVGPGLGAMTAMCLTAGASVTAFEIDRGFVSHLDERFAGVERFNLVAGDCLKTIPSLEAGAAGLEMPDFVLGNLPYNIAAHIIWYLLEHTPGVQRMAFTVQKEAAERMRASEYSRDFGPLAILCNLEYTVEPIRHIPGECFFPRPQVTSTALVLKRVRTVPPLEKAAVLAVADAAFRARRKTLLNNLGNATGDRAATASRLRAVGIEPGLRAEELGFDDFRRLAEVFSDLGQARMSS